jgi:hypothetical protein
MNAHIAPIETVYRGYRFRSRLEARWAVFFDALGIQFEYEPNAYQTHLGGYLPDFYLPFVEGGIFVEVKPFGGFDGPAIEKCMVLSVRTQKPCLFALGPPNDVFYLMISDGFSSLPKLPVEPFLGCVAVAFVSEHVYSGCSETFWYEDSDNANPGQPVVDSLNTPSSAVAASRAYRF